MGYYLGIDWGGTQVKIGVIDEKGNILCKNSIRTDFSMGAEYLITEVGRQVMMLLDLNDLSHTVVSGGIGIPGVVDKTTGTVQYAVNLRLLDDVCITAPLSRIIGIPLVLENDANAMAIGELCFGAAHGCLQVICLTIGTGIGGGIIINGSLYRGHTNAAGELGHVSIESQGLLCNCGNYGCIERYVGKDGIINRFIAYREKGIETDIERYLDNGAVTPLAIVTAANAGDHLSREVVTEAGIFLGQAFATYVNIFNPERIVVGGGIADAGELLLAPARETMIKRAYHISAQAVTVVPAHFKSDAGLIGAAAVAFTG